MSMFEHAAAVRRQRPSTENRTRPRGGCVYGLSSKCGLSSTQESAHICCGLIGDLLLRNVSGIGVHDELRASDRGVECIRGLYRDGAIVFTPQDQSRRLDVWNVIPNSLVANPAAGDRRLTCPVHPNKVPISVDHLVGDDVLANDRAVETTNYKRARSDVEKQTVRDGYAHQTVGQRRRLDLLGGKSARVDEDELRHASGMLDGEKNGCAAPHGVTTNGEPMQIENGAIELVLAQPLSRFDYLAAHVVFAIVSVAVVAFVGLLGTVARQNIFHLSPFGWDRLLRLLANLLLLQMSFVSTPQASRKTTLAGPTQAGGPPATIGQCAPNMTTIRISDRSVRPPGIGAEFRRAVHLR